MDQSKWERVPPGLLPTRQEGNSYFVDVPKGIEIRFVVDDDGSVATEARLRPAPTPEGKEGG